jgi:hypothetical protein
VSNEKGVVAGVAGVAMGTMAIETEVTSESTSSAESFMSSAKKSEVKGISRIACAAASPTNSTAVEKGMKADAEEGGKVVPDAFPDIIG